MERKFKSGKIVGTPGALELLAEVGVDTFDLLSRHLTGDWGDLDDHDRQANNQALIDGSRILSAYELPNKKKVWVITEAADAQGNRYATTFLKPEEY